VREGEADDTGPIMRMGWRVKWVPFGVNVFGEFWVGRILLEVEW